MSRFDEYFSANRKLWDVKTGIHKDCAFYDMESFRRTRNSLNRFELEALGDVSGKSLLHLQCHFGQDSLSWAHRGARVTGVDFSGEAVALARELSGELEIAADFVESNVLELDQNLDGEFDIVFTSYGTVIWLPDLELWAQVIRRFLKPGGTFYMIDFHPALYMWDHDAMKIGYDYFYRREPVHEVEQGTYADRDAEIGRDEYFWSHSIAETLQPLMKEGLELLAFEEFDSSPYPCFPNMRPREDGTWVFGDFGVSTPHLFSLKMVRPMA